MDVKSRNGEKIEIFSNFLAHPVETLWPILTVLHQNVRRSVPYILDHIWRDAHPWLIFAVLSAVLRSGFRDTVEYIASAHLSAQYRHLLVVICNCLSCQQQRAVARCPKRSTQPGLATYRIKNYQLTIHFDFRFLAFLHKNRNIHNTRIYRDCFWSGLPLADTT